MRLFFLLLSASLMLSFTTAAEVAPVVISAPKSEAWVGQRLPFYVELRARGTFSGTASFDLPQIPGAVVIKIGEPVVGTEELEGESWFVQKHEFALFSQRTGPLEIPPFSVRFSRREGYTGPASDLREETTVMAFEILRPPGSEAIGFLITTESLDITETWDPAPGPAQVGALFKRTILQRAPQIPGMVLAPAPTTAPDGIRIYPGYADTNDKLARGEFLGERSETITYLLQKPGAIELPALTYVWWNPKTKTLESKTLPAVTFDVAPSPTTLADKPITTLTHAWSWLLPVVFVGLLIWQRNLLLKVTKRLWKMANPPSKAAARKLLYSCRKDNDSAANAAWLDWRKTQNSGFRPGPELSIAIVGLQRHLFGPASAESWHGEELCRAFSKHLSIEKSRHCQKQESALPSLNPQR
jgi:hypothetical protein